MPISDVEAARRCSKFATAVADLAESPLTMGRRQENDESVPRERQEERPTSLSQPLPREKLPKELQHIVDRDDDFFDSLYAGQYVQR